MNSVDFYQRREWFNKYRTDVLAGIRPEPDYIFGLTCPCCGYPTLERRIPYEICVLCGWELDSSRKGHMDEEEKDEYSLANSCTLAQGRQRFESRYDTWSHTAAGWNDEQAIENRKQAICAFNQMLTSQSNEKLNTLFGLVEESLRANLEVQISKIKCPIRRK